MIYDLICVGAGAKSAAVAAKIHVINELNTTSPGVQVLIVERDQAAAHWLGMAGFTSGTEKLGTRPEKDVGFPYCTRASLGPRYGAVDSLMQAFSWSAYLRGFGGYSAWVDRGAPSISHHRFGSYLAWVHSHATFGIQRRTGEVTRVNRDRETWIIECTTTGGRKDTYRARSLMLTGQGDTRPLDGGLASEVLTAASRRGDLAAAIAEGCETVAVAGGGESAASAVITVLERLGPEGEVILIAPSFPRERAETHYDNAVYSNPSVIDWTSLPIDARRSFIRRTDRGVVSPAMMSVLAGDERVRFVQGRAGRVSRGLGRRYKLSLPGGDRELEADLVINCIGFDPVGQIARLLTSDARAWFEAETGIPFEAEVLSESIGTDLSPVGLRLPLFLPSLAPLSQGPGFANLSCLGLLSDRVARCIISFGSARIEGNYEDAVLR
jgi:mycobactin lysine-N-oxygenase